MVEADRCNCGGISEIGLFACAGGANVGLISVKAAAMASEPFWASVDALSISAAALPRSFAPS